MSKNGTSNTTDESNIVLTWTENDDTRSASWQSESLGRPPKQLLAVDDHLTADDALIQARAGVGLLWRGDFQNARQLLKALQRRIDAPSKRKQRRKGASEQTPAEGFHSHRMKQGQRARILGSLLVEVGPGHQLDLPRAPDVTLAATEAYGPAEQPYVVSVRELLGVISAHEWRKAGISIAELGGDKVSAHYRVFAPTRREYLRLVAETPLPEALRDNARAFDIGTGTGVLAAILARRGVSEVVATDLHPQALQCAEQNFKRLRITSQIELVCCNLYPPGQAALIVCNPPWVPAKPTSKLEYAVYDPQSQMLRGFLSGLDAHLIDGGEGWLILSDLSEHLGLRSRTELETWIAEAGMVVVDRTDARPTHKKSREQTDPLHAARAAEVTSLWRLARRARA